MGQAVRETDELELKLGFAPGFRLPELPGDELELRVFTSTYYDSADRALASSRMTLRRRVENGKSLWQLKLPREEGRLELEVAGGPGAPPARFQELLVGILRGRELEQAAKLRTRRSGISVRENGRVLADVVVDDVAVLDGRRVATRFRELEVEVVDGDMRDAERIAKRLRKAGAFATSGRPKLFRALGIERFAAPPEVKSVDAAELIRSMLARQLDEILVHDPGTRLGTDPEDLHRMRVATRRARAVLRAGRPLLEPDWTESLRDELAWLGGVLGAVRDFDVLIGRLDEQVGALEARERKAVRRVLCLLDEERSAARKALLEALSSERYTALLARLEEARSGLPVRSEGDVREVAETEFANLRKGMRALSEEISDEELHRLRIKGKRARYAAELAEPVVGKAASRFVKHAKNFQDVIGEHQDAVVAEEKLRALVSRSSAQAAFAVGRLVEQERERRLAARTALPTAWAKLEHAGRRAWR
jgi:CHAD domain-containing protein